ncbi:MAG: alanine--tRNA ligase-related protein [Methanomassiliicoccaceae archaeon]|jgi:alanyl-tRNA synthetase|nr:alanyl-tRNA editing protein [Euryarchaeota archaeon]HOB38653.1 alanine--tRNA ligase-related protein [Methanomassiliicoccaceae archaeon]HOL07235.1 alanine--tRNA ligase-related protein [Methanomassiliicoccaceae archaeon]HOQ26487.1 alanine--tRNA ligase-related protein [Methanomassiliicoccaceae archaeon]HQD88299.1 alanine--tRNA ligase-related protein [Methanomassiliicoccaceae archaeon]
MTDRLYDSDPYISRFTARVVSAEGEWIALDRTAFYPGGGGQEPDRGKLGGLPVTEVKQSEGTVLHRVPGHTFTAGQEVEGFVNWERRYELMKGHTGEHLLFSRLHQLCPEMELVKIAIGQDKKSVMVKGPLDWEIVVKAQEMALEAIEADLPVTIEIVPKDDPSLGEARMKAERIHGDEVRVVSIGEIDRAACAGVHVRSTKEIGMLLVTKFTSARPTADFEVEFQVGGAAKRTALQLSAAALRATESLGARVQDLDRALNNVLRDREMQAEQLRVYEEKALNELIPSRIGGVDLYSGLFGAMDKKMLLDAAARFTEDHAACVLGSAGDRFMLVVACSPDVDMDCAALINEVLSPYGGRGGGKMQFATGGAPTPEHAEDIMVSAIVKIRGILEKNDQENKDE